MLSLLTANRPMGGKDLGAPYPPAVCTAGPQ